MSRYGNYDPNRKPIIEKHFGDPTAYLTAYVMEPGEVVTQERLLTGTWRVDKNKTSLLAQLFKKIYSFVFN